MSKSTVTLHGHVTLRQNLFGQLKKTLDKSPPICIIEPMKLIIELFQAAIIATLMFGPFFYYFLFMMKP
jgi:hypothetical protein